MGNFIIIIMPIISFYLFFPISKTIAETDTINRFQSLSKNQTLVSKNGAFELGFFTLDNSTNHYYLGIWYKKSQVKSLCGSQTMKNPPQIPTLFY
ncbi:hypothetical protein Ahy_B08g093005 [Arachis hypogaea]|uniref:Uncharacterized protein n=1 Tax=Arachis hypogaea TaxID=3818 RepID=A0A444Y538_ARAHY|nr:hypothetical protein Ahy_B08g093005 [Arachis hypogaea]